MRTRIRLSPRNPRTAWRMAPAWIKRWARESFRFERYKERLGETLADRASDSPRMGRDGGQDGRIPAPGV
jgi:hypothetical protein